jgi:hypothetical protein
MKLRDTALVAAGAIVASSFWQTLAWAYHWSVR